MNKDYFRMSLYDDVHKKMLIHKIHYMAKSVWTPDTIHPYVALSKTVAKLTESAIRFSQSM